ncbi:MAG: type I restriction endonuclease subunit S [Campylobacterota bacterium]|nr:type I restriction endonuclease subunit S [Campylobacterota bacterium]
MTIEKRCLARMVKKEDDKFFDMLTSVQKEIAYLKEYRQSLISNAVTGKIKVI